MIVGIWKESYYPKLVLLGTTYIANFHEFYYTAIPLVRILYLHIAQKLALVEIVIVETVVGDPLYSTNMMKPLRVGSQPNFLL